MYSEIFISFFNPLCFFQHTYIAIRWFLIDEPFRTVRRGILPLSSNFLLEALQPVFADCFLGDLAFPDYYYIPTICPKLLLYLSVSGNILIKLLLPELPVCFRSCCVPATRMPVPEATVYKNHCPIFRKYYIWFPRIPAVILAIPVSFREQILSDDFLRSGVLSSYMRHIEMPLFLRQNV